VPRSQIFPGRRDTAVDPTEMEEMIRFFRGLPAEPREELPVR
jgi:hypothetical protein